MPVAILIMLGGLFTTYLSRRELMLAWRSRQWPSIIGHVSGKRILEGVCDGLSTDGTSAPEARRWKELEIIYSYTVAGVEHSSSQIDFSGFGLVGDTHYYDEGEQLTVFYCPSDPAIAVLRPGIRFSMLFGPIVILIGLCAAFYLR